MNWQEKFTLYAENAQAGKGVKKTNRLTEETREERTRKKQRVERRKLDGVKDEKKKDDEKARRKAVPGEQSWGTLFESRSIYRLVQGRNLT